MSYLHHMRLEIVDNSGQRRVYPYDATKYPHGYKMTMAVEMDDSAKPDRLKGSIWGLTEEEQEWIRSSKDLTVAVWAGYRNGLPRDLLCFSGDIEEDSIAVGYDEAGTSLSFEAGDGRNAYRYTRWDQSYSADNSTSAFLLREAAAKWGDELGPLPAGTGTETWPRRFIARGPVRDSVRRIVERMGCRYLRKGGRLLIRKIGEPFNEPFTVLRAGSGEQKSTGIIGEPVRKKDGVEFDSLLRAGVEPGMRIRVKGRDYDGDALVKTVKRNLNTDSGLEISVQAVDLNLGTV